jgi:hypothetical protein
MMSPSADFVSAGGHPIGRGDRLSTEKPKNLRKLDARRVRVHVAAVLESALLVETEHRDATRCRNVLAASWESLDLYTLAFDLAEEDDLRFLVGQARAAILSELVTRSESRRCSRRQRSSPAD